MKVDNKEATNDEVINKIIWWLNDYAENFSKTYTFVVGISGGIDSALVSTLCAMTGKKTIVVSMPIRQANDQLSRARNHAIWLQQKYTNVKFKEIDLTNVFAVFEDNMGLVKTPLSMANSKSRLRMATLYNIATVFSGLVVGTGNKVEDYGVGFFTKYGDGGVDISPIGDLYKSEVKELSRHLGINQEILDAQPTDGLWDDNRTDESQIGATYEELEFVMQNYIDELNPRQCEVQKIYNNFHFKNNHKMGQIPVCYLNTGHYGDGRF